MNADEPSRSGDPSPGALERRLAGVTLRPAPAGLRAEVLRTVANAGQAAHLPVGAVTGVPAPKPPSEKPSLRPTSRPSLFEWLFTRFPLATGGLAACWLVIWLGASADRWLNGAVAAAPVTVSAEQMAEAKAQRAELRQLAGWEEPGPTASVSAPPRPTLETPPSVTRPRGDRRRPRDEGFGRLSASDSRIAV